MRRIRGSWATSPQAAGRYGLHGAKGAIEENRINRLRGLIHRVPIRCFGRRDVQNVGNVFISIPPRHMHLGTLQGSQMETIFMCLMAHVTLRPLQPQSSKVASSLCQGTSLEGLLL